MAASSFPDSLRSNGTETDVAMRRRDVLGVESPSANKVGRPNVHVI